MLPPVSILFLIVGYGSGILGVKEGGSIFYLFVFVH